MPLKSWSANEDSDKMIHIIFPVEDEEEFNIPVWIGRVPSQSNPSDILSRETALKAKVDPREMWSLLTEVA